MAKLLLDLVPESAWGVNLRSRYPQHWDVLRRGAYKAAGYKCECCDTKAKMECHEVWNYDKPPVQRLDRLIALCSECHSAMHFGMAVVRGVSAQAESHIMKVNGWNPQQLRAHVQQAFATMRERNKVKWSTDTSILDATIAKLDVAQPQPQPQPQPQLQLQLRLPTPQQHATRAARPSPPFPSSPRVSQRRWPE